MESYYAGWLSLFPPLIAIALALYTKEVLSSLVIGLFSGTLIYSLGVHSDFVILNMISTGCAMMGKRMDFTIIVFCITLNALVYVIYCSGGSHAYGKLAVNYVRTKRSAQLSTVGLGCCVFIDDYFNCVTVGTAMRPIMDSLRISRAKLAYLIDSTAAPICILAPISSWAVAVSSNLGGTGIFESDFSAFLSAIPYNFYALLALMLTVLVSFFNLDFGPMRKCEIRVQKQGNIEAQTDEENIEYKKGCIMDMLFPLCSLIILALLLMLQSGGYWGKDTAFHTMKAAFGNCKAAESLMIASVISLFFAFLLYVPRRLMTLHEFMDGVVRGVTNIISAVMVLIMAWGISGVCQELLQTPQFVQKTLSGLSVGAVLPALIFCIACILSFSLGTSWGTFSILIPLVVPIAQAACPDLTLPALSAVLAGSVFGDHCSPISDTTIVSSAAAGCLHLEHVNTQLPYCILAAACSAAGYLVVGFFKWNAYQGLFFSFLLMCAVLFVLKRHYDSVEKTSNSNDYIR